jgi:hypothetical protein
VVVAVVATQVYNNMALLLAVVAAVMDMKVQEPQEQVDKEMLALVVQVLVVVVVEVQEPQDQYLQVPALVVQVVLDYNIALVELQLIMQAAAAPADILDTLAVCLLQPQ